MTQRAEEGFPTHAGEAVATVTLAVDGNVRKVEEFDRLHVTDTVAVVAVAQVANLTPCPPPPVGTDRRAPGYAGLRVEAQGVDLEAFEGFVRLNGSWYRDPHRIVETLVLERCAELGCSRSLECLRSVSRAARQGRTGHLRWTWLRGRLFA